jgi:uncharacterized damage-inducible protein DinB
MDKDVAVLKRFAEYAFEYLERTCQDLTEEEAEWRPVEEANNTRWILNHISRITNISLPRTLKKDSDYTPSGWPENYREETYSVEELLRDINGARATVDEAFDVITSQDLAEEIPGRRGPRKLELALFTYINEIISHKGQIAAIRGNIKRRREKDPEFLT